MIKKKHYFIGLLIVTFAFSCEKTKYKSKITQAYQIENTENGNYLKINNLKILDIKEVGPEYGDTLIVNHYLNSSKSILQVIQNTQNVISLLDSNIIKYQKLIKIGKESDIPNYNAELNDSELRLIKQKESLNESQKIIEDINDKIHIARSKTYSENPKNFKLIKYSIVATIDSIQLNDTLSIVFNEDMKWSFVKNDVYCNYLGK